MRELFAAGVGGNCFRPVCAGGPPGALLRSALGALGPGWALAGRRCFQVCAGCARGVRAVYVGASSKSWRPHWPCLFPVCAGASFDLITAGVRGRCFDLIKAGVRGGLFANSPSLLRTYSGRKWRGPM